MVHGGGDRVAVDDGERQPDSSLQSNSGVSLTVCSSRPGRSLGSSTVATYRKHPDPGKFR